jgi:hypothetical protein
MFKETTPVFTSVNYITMPSSSQTTCCGCARRTTSGEGRAVLYPFPYAMAIVGFAVHPAHLLSAVPASARCGARLIERCGWCGVKFFRYSKTWR